jgi:DnaK suppressor protein
MNMKKERDIKIRTRLEALRNEIFKVIGWNESASSGGGAMDEIDQANELIEKEMGFLMSSNMINNLKEVEEALERIKKNEYGKCQHCGTEISAKRLEVLPFAKFCVPCQENMESGGGPG